MTLLSSRRHWSVNDWVDHFHSADTSPDQRALILAEQQQIREEGQRALQDLPLLPPKEITSSARMVKTSEGWASLDARVRVRDYSQRPSRKKPIKWYGSPT